MLSTRRAPELMEDASLKKDPSTMGVYTLLELFAYGTYQDYLRERPQEIYLSCLQCSSRNSATSHWVLVDYSMLLEYLELANVRELEDLIIEAIFANQLESWSNSTDGVFSSISAIESMVQSRVADQKKKREEYEKAVEAVKSAKEGSENGAVRWCVGGAGGYA
ncbi:hypothetical protein BJ742DRAFT_774247 [Cladochytrium replicatum]|nr:hypothetical protein BJ742DRAFT_774247 [Cladochytrium replicatum]